MALWSRARPSRQWSVVVAAPKGPDGDQWGDTWFAQDVVDALERAGERARVVRRGGASSAAREDDDVVLVLRGLRRVVPRRGRATWLLWVISHPELVEADEPADYDAAFAASAHWSRADDFGAPVAPLLQATAPERFRPEAAAPDTGARVLFVGSTRGEFRPIVRDALAAGVEVDLYGVGWEKYVSPDQVAGAGLPNADLPAAYAAAGVVLNDHWADMAAEGFVSNRLFDAAAAGTRVLSDRAVGVREVFGDVVRTYDEPAMLGPMLTGDLDDAFPARAERLALARHVAQEHSFDARVAVLVETVDRLRGAR
jgi:hypothetical protein